LTSQCQSRRIPDKRIVEREVAAWQNHRNKHHHKNDTRAKLKRLILALRVDQTFHAIPPLDAGLSTSYPNSLSQVGTAPRFELEDLPPAMTLS
jgi:hypothetical protein